ncbi:hypothetical protein AALP_AA2G019800 [Arabis alpina]|uniref:Uncharacterized protein n=1 Tax=Arabis alpina TaxID=50452 RepID=A0A087HER7_ARAAL|nr:hypothetical protein AALP_AA2G019800 [Arabis alpina]
MSLPSDTDVPGLIGVQAAAIGAKEVLIGFRCFVACQNINEGSRRQLEGVTKETKIGVSSPRTATTNGLGAELAYVSVGTSTYNSGTGEVRVAVSPPGPSSGAIGTCYSDMSGYGYAESPHSAYVGACSNGNSDGSAEASAAPEGATARGAGMGGGQSYSTGGGSR